MVRFDTAHGFAHRDILHPWRGTIKTELAIRDFNEALTFAIEDLAENWRQYRERHEEWQRQEKKVTSRVRRSGDTVERNIRLLGELMRYLLAEPKILNSLPSDFELVILPEDDPQVRQLNLELLDKYGSEGKPIVFARLRARKGDKRSGPRPDLYVPLAA